MNRFPDVRPSPIAGTWYSANPQYLRDQLSRFISEAHIPALEGEVVGLVAPHAGYRYSGAVAGHAFRAVSGQEYGLVAVVSPMHSPYPEPLLTTSHQAYATPLGEVPVEMDVVAELGAQVQKLTGLSIHPVARDPEHSLEIELPFLQVALKGSFALLPLMLRAQDADIAAGLGRALADTLLEWRASHAGRRALLVASTDLSHFYPEESANQLDQATLEQIEAFSPEGLYQEAMGHKVQACGMNAVAAVLWAARDLGADTVKILSYATSASTTGDRSSVVGYGAAAILKTL